LVRYMFLMTPDEQKRLLSATPAPPKPAASAAPAPQKTGRGKVRTGSGSDRVIAGSRRSKQRPRTLAQLRYAHRAGRRR